MSGGAHALKLAGQRLELLPERALWWPERRCLFIADLHLGKDQVFRDHGIAIPHGLLEADLLRLGTSIRRHGACRLVIIGDLVHAPPKPGEAWVRQVANWRETLPPVAIDVALGNHDRRLDAVLERWGMRAEPELAIGPFRCVHDPADVAADGHDYALCGHLHPVWKLRDGAGRLRLPAFWERPRALVLPSYGIFTGGHLVRPAPADRLYVVGDQAVYPVPPFRSPTNGTRAGQPEST